MIEKKKLQESVSKLENTLEKKKIFDKVMQYHPDINYTLAIIYRMKKWDYLQNLSKRYYKSARNPISAEKFILQGILKVSN